MADADHYQRDFYVPVTAIRNNEISILALVKENKPVQDFEAETISLPDNRSCDIQQAREAGLENHPYIGTQTPTKPPSWGR